MKSKRQVENNLDEAETQPEQKETGRVAHRCRIHLNNKQASWMRDNCIGARLAYNYAVAELKAVQKGEKWPTPYDIRKKWSQERDTRHPWMKERKLVMGAMNDAINVNFASSLANWKRAKYSPDKAPRFHSRRHPLSVTWTYTTLSNRHVNQRTVTLPMKMGTARLGQAIRYPGKIMQSTISAEGGRWHISFLIAHTPPKPESAPEGTAVGCDVGVVNFVALSDGERLPPATDFEKEHAKLVRLQKALSKMQGPIKGQRKASNNWRKQQERVAKQARRIANLRKNYSEHVALDLAKRFETVAIEDLSVKKMTKSAKGSEEKPGKNVQQKADLNRSILNGGFFQFRTRLEAKVNARGGKVIAVNPAFTSQTCPACGHVHIDNRKTRDTFLCVKCGHGGHADVIAAQNILHRALTTGDAVKG